MLEKQKTELIRMTEVKIAFNGWSKDKLARGIKEPSLDEMGWLHVFAPIGRTRIVIDEADAFMNRRARGTDRGIRGV